VAELKSLDWRRDIILGTLLSILLPLLFFWPLWTPNLTDRRSIVIGDFTHQYYPLRAFAARELAAGRLPLWNPHIYGGQPGLADPQMAVLYPPNLIPALLFGNRFSLYLLEWQVILHFMLAALFMFWFVRRRTGHFLAGIVAAIAFTFGGYLTSFPVQQVTILETAVWLPLIFLFIDWGLDGETTNRLVAGSALAGLALGMAILAGHPQTALYLFYAALAFTIWRWRARGRGRSRELLILPMIPLVALGVAAAQLLPTAEFIARSSRQAASYTFASSGMAWHELTVLLLPNFFGGSPLYLGIATLALVIVALLLRRWGPERWLWAGMALLSLLLALGGNSFLYGLFYLGVPGFSKVRDQERALLLFSFAAAVLAGMGVSALLERLRVGDRGRLRLFHRWWGTILSFGLLPVGYLYVLRARALAGGGGDAGVIEGFLDRSLFLLVVAALVWAILWGIRRRGNRPLLGSLLVLILLFDLFSVNWQYNLSAKSPAQVFPPSSAVAWLQTHADEGRIASAGKLVAGANAGLIYNWEDTTGNDPLRLQRTVQFARKVSVWQRWQLLHVAYVVSHKPLHDENLSFRFNDDRVAIYSLNDPFPRAWLVHDVSVARSEDALWNMLNSPQTDLRKTAVVESAVEGRLDLDIASESGEDRAEVRERTADRLLIETTSPAASLLVVSQVFYPGWIARLDGQDVTLYRVDGILQGVSVPPGVHQVELLFRPASFRWGLLISVLTLLMTGAILLRIWWTY